MKNLIALVLVALLAFLVVVAFSPPTLGPAAEPTELVYNTQQQTAPVDGLPGAVADLPYENVTAGSETVAVYSLGSMCPVQYDMGQLYATKDAAPPLFLPPRGLPENGRV